MKNTITMILLTITGCESKTDNKQKTEMSEYKKTLEKIKKEKEVDVTIPDNNRASANDGRASRKVLLALSGSDFEQWDNAMLSWIFERREALEELGYSDNDLGIGFVNTVPVMLPNLVSNKLSTKMMNLARDSRLIDDEVGVEMMAKLHNTVLMFTVLKAELEGKKAPNKIVMPDLDLKDYNGRVYTFGQWKKLNTEYNFGGQSVGMVKLIGLCKKYDVPLSAIMHKHTTIFDMKMERFGKINVDVFGDVYQTGPYAFIGDTPKEQMYKEMLVALSATKDINVQVGNEAVSHYPHFNLVYTK